MRNRHSAVLLGLVLSGAAAPAVAADHHEATNREAAAAPEIRQGERVALVGGVLPCRMALTGHLETKLQVLAKGKELRVRNFGWPTDTAATQVRPNDYTRLDDPLAVFDPTMFVVFVGGNEAFGEVKPGQFAGQVEKYLGELKKTYGDGREMRFVVVGPTAFEDADSEELPDGKAYTAAATKLDEAAAGVARKLGHPYVSLLHATETAYGKEPGLQHTTDGFHVTEAGDRLVSDEVFRAFAGPGKGLLIGQDLYETLRTAVRDKAWHHQQDYRMVNGWYVYGGRNTPFGVRNFPAEFDKLRAMVAKRDELIWKLAAGEDVPLEMDDSDTGDLVPVDTAFGTKTYSEPEELRILTPAEAEAAMTVADGYELTTFASEVTFPELANPVQLNFDDRGRLWVSCMPTYPQWKPGDPKPNDRLLILEDTDGDGVADKSTTFADDLHVPTGFEFFGGGVLVTSQPHLMFLKDTDDDDVADVREVFMDGWATDDTHHAIGAFEWSAGGRLMMLEGISLCTTVETPWGPFVNKNGSSTYRLDPWTRTVGRHVAPCFANPWCFTTNDWGQEFVGDGTGAQQHWATPLSGAVYRGRKGTDQFTKYDGPPMRPALGNEFLFSRALPDDDQGDFVYACVINMNGILRFRVTDDGSGYLGTRKADLVTSTDKNFRPGDPQVGPDGALYFVDWQNPLIGHMQYSQRDPNRDHRHGRVYRMAAVGKQPVAPVTQHGKSEGELLEQFREPESRTRYRVRRALRDRPWEKVEAALNQWLPTLDAGDPLYPRLITEALWVTQGHRKAHLLGIDAVRGTDEPDARAAAAHVLSDRRQPIDPSEALSRLAEMVTDENLRVRLEAVRALSFFETPEAAEIALTVLDKPSGDEMLNYTLDATMAALRPLWEPAFEKGTAFAAAKTPALSYIRKLTSKRSYDEPAREAVKLLLEKPFEPGNWRGREALDALTAMEGDAAYGKRVFERSCVACHQLDALAGKYAPNLGDVGKRLKPEQIVSSVLYPNAELNEKYQTYNILTADGEVLSGVIAEQTDEAVTVMLGTGKTATAQRDDIEAMKKVNVSSMPAGLTETMSGEEFVDLLTYLNSLKADLPKEQ